jgi:uncharacterized protein YacL
MKHVAGLFLIAAAAGAAFLLDGSALAWQAAGAAALAAGLVLSVEAAARRQPVPVVTGGALGLGAGLVIALVAAATVAPALGPAAARVVPVLLALFGAYLGAAVGLRRGRRGDGVRDLRTEGADARRGAGRGNGQKVLDTSVIIDGRIADIVAAGFVEGTLVIPQFVLRELQQVADSSDSLKRNRGRKGLDILKVVQDSPRVDVEVTDQDFPDLRDVDAKLLALAEGRGAKVLTNDYNLNKVAQLRGVPVLNVNDLANAMKPVVLPGESLTVQVLKEGKERNQGVGYLDDGTMVVVDGGKPLIGQTVDVVVTSVIQTNAGKMIFGSPDDAPPVVRPRVARRAPGVSLTNGTDGRPLGSS